MLVTVIFIFENTRNPEAMFDREIKLKAYVNIICKSWFYHISKLTAIHNMCI